MRTFHPESLGPTLAKLREQAHMTQKELAEKVGASNVFLSNLERGEKHPKLKTLCSLAQALDVSCDAILFDEAPDAHLTTINQLLSGKPIEFIEGIEKLIRVCNEQFLREDINLEKPAVCKSHETEVGRDQR